jgi:hypothetical protein
MSTGEEGDEYLIDDFALADNYFAEFRVNLRAGGDEFFEELLFGLLGICGNKHAW